MKFAVLADVHANLPALKRVLDDIDRWGPDQVVVAGDIVNRGPRSLECLDLVMSRVSSGSWQVLRGNHEDYVIAQASPDSPRSGGLADAFQATHWTYRELNQQVAVLASWPLTAEFEGPDGRLVRVAHASADNNQRGVFVMNSDQEMLERAGQPTPALFCTAHTHFPLVRRIGSSTVVNVGAAGLPFDADWRASYGRFEWDGAAWRIEIVRLEYDRDQLIADYKSSGYLRDAGPLSWLILAEMLHSKPQLFAWHRDCFEGVQAGRLGMAESVQRQLESQGMWEQVRLYLP
jgi:predicted phosphodiesterase